MRAKTVFEGYGYEEEELGREEFSRQIEDLHQYGPNNDEFNDNSSIEYMAFEIAQAVESTYNGDDIDYEPNDEDIETLENIIKETIKEGHLYVDEDDEDLENFADEKWILDNVPENEISELYQALQIEGFINVDDKEVDSYLNDEINSDED